MRQAFTVPLSTCLLVFPHSRGLFFIYTLAEFFWLEILVEVRLGLTDIGNADKYSILSLNGLGEI